jgi:N-acetylglutamate synthase-like GNAT family acetyltransferase
MVEIIDYKDFYESDFRRINLEWLDKYSLKEELDVVTLNNPRETILDTGGVIFLAKADGEIIGSAALIDEHDGVFELAKMAVVPAWQGKGISNRLMEKCLERAKELQAKRIILFSHSSLNRAIGLYAKYGFKHVEVTDSPFAMANVKMELEMNVS